MSRHNPDLPKIGTVASLKPYRRVDSRECRKCGAVAGRCQHLAADEDIIWISASKEARHDPAIHWTQRQRDTMRILFEGGKTAGEIAELMNTTRSAVSGLLARMGVRRS